MTELSKIAASHLTRRAIGLPMHTAGLLIYPV